MAKVSLRAYNREIEAMVDRGHLEEAVAHCQHILKTFPKHLETYRLLGKAYLEAKRHNEAVDIFTRVLSAEPNDFVAHVGMSIIRDEQNKIDDAIWHMERAFEVQSANPAIQSELQRLYGRREGVQPPRIRMTRGALAHMYMRGELYPQAISETKGVLEDDQGRSDMQVLLAKAYYKSGQKKDAADAASLVLKRYPFCLDANLVLAEVLGTDRPESAQIYRHRVIELDPYASQVVENMFRASEVSDAAVSIEHLEWNGQPVGMSTDWSSSRSIGLEAGLSGGDEQPEWMKTSFPEESAPAALEFASDDETSSTPAQPEDDIPDFLRAAGWGTSTGAFDEGKSSVMFEDEPVSAAEPTAEGDLPDWVKAMAPHPQEAGQPPEEQAEEEMPDWINKIGTDELPVPSAEPVSDEGQNWISGLGETSASQPSDEGMDWMKGSAQEESLASASDDLPDWMKDFKQEEQPAPASDEQPDWMKDIDMAAPLPAGEEPGPVLELEPEGLPSSQKPEEQLDWMKDFEQESVPTSSEVVSGDEEFLAELKSETEGTPAPSASAVDTGRLGTSEEEQDDSFAWLESLAAKQGATEGLLTKPEERLEDEPEWVRQAKSLTHPAASTEPVIPQPETSMPVPAVDTGSLGASEQEQDDSFAWLEALAAKQGATEGLLTKPEERLEDEPEWVKQARTAETQQPVAEELPPVEEETIPEPELSAAGLEETESERDDSFARLEDLASEQGATDSPLTELEDATEWVRQEGEVPAVVDEEPSAVMPEVEADAEMQDSVPAEETPSWLKGFDEEVQEEVASAVAADDTISWLKSLDEPEEEPITLESSTSDLPDWMQDVGMEDVTETEPAVPTEEAESPAPESEEVPSWLSSLEEEETTPAIPASEDLPAWMRDETGEVVAEPTRIEPTRSSDWTPVNEVEEETVETPQPAPQPVSGSEPEHKPKKSAPKKEKAKPAQAEPYKEPVTRRATETTMSIDPILDSARTELSRSNIPGALDAYGKLIKKGRFLEEVIFDLREALYRYPVEVSIWQALGDAYMRSNQLQDALDAYTKAEELLR
jgi:tetratricopeptide (TPR) repeat protein